ncbi:MAG: DUF86 domain-containing protein [Burkholderiales bacterium]|nr:hypothetical protein [Rhodocyclaceae bacterium]MCZ2174457.1 DUF86 domain-containing protein [Burkholderiales bacterium]
MSPRKWQNRIQDILDAIAEIQSFVEGYTYERFRGDARTIKAVGANLMIIGEAAAHIPEEVQSAAPAVPWHLMRAMRNRVVHVYFDIDPAILWDIVQRDLPALTEPLRELAK